MENTDIAWQHELERRARIHAAGAVHYVLTRLFARGRGWGQYP